MYRILGASILLLAAYGLQFLSFLLIARGLGPTLYGELSAINAFALPATALVGWGTGEALLQRASRHPRIFPYVFANSLLTIAVTAPIIAFAVIILCYLLVVPDLSLTTTGLLVITEIIVVPHLGHIEFLFLANASSILVNVQRVIVAAARCGLAGIFFFVLHKSDLRVYVYAYFSVMLIVTIVSLISLIIIFGRPRFHPRSGRFLIGTGFVLLQFARSITWSVDKIALSFMLDYDQIGIYNAGARILQVALIPIGFILRDTYSNFFRIGLKGIEATFSYGKSILPKIFVVSVASSLAAAIVAFSLPYLLGPHYEKSASVGAIIGAAGIAIALQNVAGDIMTGADKQAIRMVTVFMGIPLTSLAIFLGSWRYGPFGAAIAFVTAQLLLAGATWFTVYVLRR